MKHSVILYVQTKLRPLNVPIENWGTPIRLNTPGLPALVYIRHEVTLANIQDALDAAKPRVGEVVLNTIEVTVDDDFTANVIEGELL